MRFKFSVSFESDTAPVVTLRGDVEKASPEEAFQAAVFRAFKDKPKGRHYRSWVCVIEEIAEASNAA